MTKRIGGTEASGREHRGNNYKIPKEEEDRNDRLVP